MASSLLGLASSLLGLASSLLGLASVFCSASFSFLVASVDCLSSVEGDCLSFDFFLSALAPEVVVAPDVLVEVISAKASANVA